MLILSWMVFPRQVAKSCNRFVCDSNKMTMACVVGLSSENRLPKYFRKSWFWCFQTAVNVWLLEESGRCYCERTNSASDRISTQ